MITIISLFTLHYSTKDSMEISKHHYRNSCTHYTYVAMPKIAWYYEHVHVTVPCTKKEQQQHSNSINVQHVL